MKRSKQSKRQLERFAVLLWHGIKKSAEVSPEAERERLFEAANAMHAARMVLTGSAMEMADTLYELAWTRLAQLDRATRRHPRQEVHDVAA